MTATLVRNPPEPDGPRTYELTLSGLRAEDLTALITSLDAGRHGPAKLGAAGVIKEAVLTALYRLTASLERQGG